MNKNSLEEIVNKIKNKEIIYIRYPQMSNRNAKFVNLTIKGKSLLLNINSIYWSNLKETSFNGNSVHIYKNIINGYTFFSRDDLGKANEEKIMDNLDWLELFL